MPEYLTPGVYVEEFEMGARPIEGVSTSTGGFLGVTERGPTDRPRLVTSFAQFNRIFGKYLGETKSYLAYAMDGFFSNGGQRCYIGRIVPGGSTFASKLFDTVTFKSTGEGECGNRTAINIENASSDDPKKPLEERKRIFKLTVAYWSEKPDFSKLTNENSSKPEYKDLMEKAYVEMFDNLSEDPTSPDHYIRKFGDPLNNLSNLVVLSGSGRPSNTGGFVPLEGGEDGAELLRDDFRGKLDSKPGDKRGLEAFKEIDDINNINIPDLQIVNSELRKQLVDDLLSHCEELKDRFAIIDVPLGSKDVGSLTIDTSGARPSKYGALYYPWIKIYDPLTRSQKLKPSGGYIAGIYARSDIERGVHKAPANELVRGAVDLEFNITKGDQGMLNPRGINVIRNFPGRGILVWGARTCIIDPLWKYINVRRLFLFVEESIEEGTQWVVFEPNDEKLWARVRATITQFLTKVWKDGALMGTKVEEAFFVKCDRTTMTQDDIDNGRLICVIGIAPVKPAEFVIFRIAQWQGGSAAKE
jgi:phage tail sheath protein FI